MTTAERIVLGLYTAIVAAWPIRHLVLTIIARKIDVLTAQSPRYSGPEPPLVTAIIPARNEEADLADCLATVRAQDYPNLEILIVDDRSHDATAAIAGRLAAVDHRVRLLTINDLPPGWTGKTHALHVAAAEAQGAWFWFLDADTRHAPASLAIVMEYARVQGAALASLVPDMRCATFWEGVVNPLAGIVLMRSYPPFLVNRDDHPLAFANGQYILIERSAYEAAGGHRAVRDRFVEDIYMAKNVKGIGRPIRVALGTEISTTRMYTSLPRVVRGWSRILYDALGRRPWPLIGKIIEPLIFSQTGGLALLAALGLLMSGHAGPFAWWLLALSVVHLVLQLSVLYRMYRMSSPSAARYAVCYPLAGLISDWILLRALVMCWTGRVTWRGTSYGPVGDAGRAVPEPTVPRSSADCSS
jgi:glycosyltransferase involved in cell wall biosynthesis